MILRLFLYLGIYLVPICAALGLLGYKVIWPWMKPMLAERKQLRLGIRNASAFDLASHKLCVLCSKKVSPEKDIYDSSSRNWFHTECYGKAIAAPID
jgi:hypothetical protein